MVEAERVLDACGKYIFGEEVGEQGTPHLQGAVRFKQKQRFTAVTKLFPGKGVHWEKMKKPWERSLIYCAKEMKGDWSKLHGNVPEASRWKPYEKLVLEQEYKDVDWYPWQQDVIDIINGPVHPRRVYWFWEPEGDSGKSYLMKWLALNYTCIIGGGKQADVFHQVAVHFETNVQTGPTLVLLDIPRSSQKFCNYGAIEALKNGSVNSGKYVGGQFQFLKPHVVVLANEEPAYEEMSDDRWCVKKIVKKRKKRTVAQALGVASSRNLIV